MDDEYKEKQVEETTKNVEQEIIKDKNINPDEFYDMNQVEEDN